MQFPIDMNKYSPQKLPGSTKRADSIHGVKRNPNTSKRAS